MRSAHKQSSCIVVDEKGSRRGHFPAYITRAGLERRLSYPSLTLSIFPGAHSHIRGLGLDDRLEPRANSQSLVWICKGTKSG